MGKDQALYEFWSGFGLPAYDQATVPTGDDAPDFPYITYETQTGNIGADILLNASLWYRSTSWDEISNRKDEIARFIGYGCKIIKIDGGYMKIHLPDLSSFATRMSDPSDDMVRRYLLSVYVEFLTAD